MTVTPETVAALIAQASRYSHPVDAVVHRPTVLAIARSWQDQHTELDRLRTIIAALVELDSEQQGGAHVRLGEVDG